jgi:hypothetical protein
VIWHTRSSSYIIHDKKSLLISDFTNFFFSQECAQISIREVKNTDGACFLELKLPSRSRLRDGCWNFLERYGFRYGDDFTRPLLPCEVCF